MPSSNITHDQTHSLSDSTATLAVAVSALTHCSYSHDWCVTWHSLAQSFPPGATEPADGRTERAPSALLPRALRAVTPQLRRSSERRR